MAGDKNTVLKHLEAVFIRRLRSILDNRIIPSRPSGKDETAVEGIFSKICAELKKAKIVFKVGTEGKDRERQASTTENEHDGPASEFEKTEKKAFQ